MRRILVDHARAADAAKRGGDRERVTLNDANAWAQPRGEDLLALDEALSRLADLDVRAARVVELRYFGGLSEIETGQALGISVPTVKRDWSFARTWLLSQLTDRTGP